jgi:hypothetical protein
MVLAKCTPDLNGIGLSHLSFAGLRREFSSETAPTKVPVETPPKTKPDVKPEPDIVPDRKPVPEPKTPLGPRPDSPCPTRW